MKITSVRQQLKRSGRYSIFVDGKYSFSLSEASLLESKLVNGQELNAGQVREYQRLSANDKIYNQTLQYIALRPRTKWEIETYLKRKNIPPTLLEIILNKLSKIELIDDKKYAEALVNDRRMLRPTSRRKLINDLRKKHVAAPIIEEVISSDLGDDQIALKQIIDKKRRQAKYQDELKLMQYLARQGFNYGDIKDALKD